MRLGGRGEVRARDIEVIAAGRETAACERERASEIKKGESREMENAEANLPLSLSLPR